VKIIISEQLNYIFKRFVLLMGAGKGEREVMVDRYCLNMLGEREVMVDRYCLNMLKQNGVPIDTGRNCYYLTKDCDPIPILTAAIKILHV
jgi:hypothetical protein